MNRRADVRQLFALTAIGLMSAQRSQAVLLPTPQ